MVEMVVVVLSWVELLRVGPVGVMVQVLVVMVSPVSPSQVVQV